jgi:maleate cis-trans isomerase
MASKRRLRRISCSKKKAYTQVDAENKAHYLRNKGIDVHAYACTFGNHSHVGHRPNKLTRMIDERQGLTSLASVGRFKRL